MSPQQEKLVKYLSEVPESQKPQVKEEVHQLTLPFDQPINLELRVSPQRADTILFSVQWKNKAG